jgi:hypothetical protein
MITGLETNAEYYIRRADNTDYTPSVTIVQLLYPSGQDRIIRDDFEIVGYSTEEGYKYKYVGTNDTAFFDYNFEISNGSLILGQVTNRPAIRIRKVLTATAITNRSIIAIVDPLSSITGTSLTCNGEATYYLQNQPEGSSVQWTISQNNNIRAQGNGITASTSNLTNGSVKVEFEISFSCNLDPVSLQETYWSGVPVAPTINQSSPLYVSINTVFNVIITASPGAEASTGIWETYNCVYPNGTPSGANSEFYSCNTDGCGTIYISTSNECGTQYKTALTVLTGSGGDCEELPERNELSSLTISPNPATERIELSLDVKKKGFKEDFLVEIYNVYFNLVKSFHIYTTKESINVSDLPKGNYVFIVHGGNSILWKKLIIQK